MPTEDGVGDSTAAPDSGDEPDPSPGRTAADAVRERTRTIRDEQVERACSRLAARDELTPARREAVATLADRLVERLVASPTRGDETDEAHLAADPDAAATAAILRALAEE